jgi:hypothetical protein
MLHRDPRHTGFLRVLSGSTHTPGNDLARSEGCRSKEKLPLVPRQSCVRIELDIGQLALTHSVILRVEKLIEVALLRVVVKAETQC